MASATVVVNLTQDASVRLATSTSALMSSPTYTSAQSTANHRVKLTATGLTSATTYYYAAEINGTLDATVGTFRTRNTSASTLRIAFAGDAVSGSNHTVYSSILSESPDFFIHLGDLHYQDIDVDNPDLFFAAYDGVLAQTRPAALFRNVPIVYAWDDHDYGPNDSDGSSIPRKTSLRAYRRAVPHFTLESATVTDPIYHSFEATIAGVVVMFIVTDLRSAANPKSATDNASKTMMGATQKTWFKALFANAANDDKLFVWICSRVWGGATTAGADHWGGFNTERVELANQFKAEAPGRVIVLSADGHFVGIDAGANHNFATGGGDPIPTFQAAPLDQTPDVTYGGGTYSKGTFGNNGQYGLMTIAKTGALQLTVDWEGKTSAGVSLVTHQMVLNL